MLTERRGKPMWFGYQFGVDETLRTMKKYSTNKPILLMRVLLLMLYIFIGKNIYPIMIKYLPYDDKRK